MKTVKIVTASGKEYSIPQKSVAHINSKKCVNCNECREACPVGAIEENQRIICHACPECTAKPGISPKKFVALATAKSCTTACPLGISPQGYVNLLKAGKEKEAYEIIWKKNPLAEVCGNICHHPCEQDCKRGILVDRPIEIRNIKRYLAETNNVSHPKYQRMYDETVAIIGADPAGLTAGHYLAQSGYRVTIFESDKEAGGMLLHGIPKFRLDREVVRKEIKSLENAGLEIRYGEQINKYSMKKLMDEYDAVIVAAGTPKSRELEIKGFRTEGIFPAMKYMEMVNADQKVRHHLGQMYVENGEAVIVGGGSIAIDVARVALRQGATKVTVVSSEKGEKLPAHQWEIDEAKEEGKFYMDINHEVTKDIKADFVILAIGNLAEGYWKEFKEEGNTMSCFSLNAKNPECRTTTFLCIVPYKTLETLDMSLEEVFEWWIHHSKQGPKYMKNAKLLSPKKGWRLVGTKYQQKNYAPGAFVIGDACSGPEGDHFYGIPPSMWGGRTAAYLIQEMYEQNDFSEAKFATFYDKMCDMLNSEYDFYETTRKIMKSDPMLPMIKEFTQFAKAQPGYPNVGYGQMTVRYLKEVHGISYPKRDSKISIGQ